MEYFLYHVFKRKLSEVILQRMYIPLPLAKIVASQLYFPTPIYSLFTWVPERCPEILNTINRLIESFIKRVSVRLKVNSL